MRDWDTTMADGLPHQEAVENFVEHVEHADLDALTELILFGSVVRGAHKPDSDVDVLAIVDSAADKHAVEESLRDIAYDVMLKHGVVFSIHAVPESTFERRADHPFFQTIAEEGQPIYG